MTKQIYSVVMHWARNDTEQGTYGACVMAEDSDEAERLVREEMAALDDGPDDVNDFILESMTVGVNIWAAKVMLEALQFYVKAQPGPGYKGFHSREEIRLWIDTAIKKATVAT